MLKTNGAPQRSIVGSILFSIYVEDMDNTFTFVTPFFMLMINKHIYVDTVKKLNFDMEKLLEYLETLLNT